MEKVITTNIKDYKDGGFKVVEVNVSNPAESLYAVCTPIKKR